MSGVDQAASSDAKIQPPGMSALGYRCLMSLNLATRDAVFVAATACATNRVPTVAIGRLMTREDAEGAFAEW